MMIKEAKKLRNTFDCRIFQLSFRRKRESFFIIGATVMCSCPIPHFLNNNALVAKSALGRNEADYFRFYGGKLEL